VVAKGADILLNRVVNRFTRALLRSPVHDLLSSTTALLTYVGRRSGDARTVPVNYLRDDDRLLVTSLRRRRWWRNFREARPVDVLLAGVNRTATAELLDLSHAEVSEIVARMYRELAGGREPPRDRVDGTVVIELRLEPPPPGAPPLRGAPLWRRWTAWTTLGEVVGFAIPSLTWAALAAAGVPEAASVPFIVLAGAGEGAALGLAQAAALRAALPDLPTVAWVRATAAGAALAWAAALVPTVLLAGAPAAAAATALPAGAVVLLAMGILQRRVLRLHLPTAGPWVAATAAAWLVGLAVFMAVATPLWHEGQHAGEPLAIGLGAGLLMAFTVAVVLGAVVVRLVTAALRSAWCGQATS
jgi:deazaflavin-dependent oxidoreductase (nitroreductase family)